MGKLHLTAAIVALSLGLYGCDQTQPTPAQPGAPASTSPSPTTSTGEPVTDGGAEQTADQAIPGAPSTPVQPPGGGGSVTGFNHLAAGDIIPGSGSGYLDRAVWSPHLCFPLAEAAFANSQVYGAGGSKAPPGLTSQCDASNYKLPWRDNFCEARGYASPVCAGGTGHQGQDIRPATCKKATHWAVAAEDGIITGMGGYSVTLTASAAPHLVYRYLHLSMKELAVSEGASVHAGDHIGKTSNDFGATPTTIHTHFEIRAGVTGVTQDGKAIKLHTFLPPYQSLVSAYQRKLDGGNCHTP